MTIRRSLVAVALVVTSLAWNAHPAAASRAKISLSRSSGPVGVSVKVTGSDYARLQSLSVWFNDSVRGNVVVARTTTSRHGGFSVSFRVPPNPGGPHQIVAVDGRGHRSSPVNFTITAKLALIPTGIAPKDKICVQIGIERQGAYTEKFNLTGYPASASVRIYLRATSGQSVTAHVALTNRYGSASGTYIQPRVPSGRYLARTAVGTTSFPTTVAIGSRWYTCYAFSGDARPMRWRADGVGFLPSTPVKISWTGARSNPIFHDTVEANGSLTGAFTVPCAPSPGTYTVTTNGTDGQGRPIFVQTKNRLRTKCG